MFLIFSYLLELPENLDKKNFIFYFKIGIIGATAFIIYPNGIFGNNGSDLFLCCLFNQVF